MVQAAGGGGVRGGDDPGPLHQPLHQHRLRELQGITRPDKQGRVLMVPCKKMTSIVRYCKRVHWKSHFIHGARNT